MSASLLSFASPGHAPGEFNYLDQEPGTTSESDCSPGQVRYTGLRKDRVGQCLQRQWYEIFNRHSGQKAATEAVVGQCLQAQWPC